MFTSHTYISNIQPLNNYEAQIFLNIMKVLYPTYVSIGDIITLVFQPTTYCSGLKFWIHFL